MRNNNFKKLISNIVFIYLKKMSLTMKFYFEII